MAGRRRKAQGAGEGGAAKKQARKTRTRKTNVTSGNTSTRVTRQMTTDGPRQAVFATAELLENIIMRLPPKQIFAVQRVSRQFRDVVSTSVKVQEKMLLRLASVPIKAWQLHIDDDIAFEDRLTDVSASGRRPEDLEKGNLPRIRVYILAQLSPVLMVHLRYLGANSAQRLEFRRGEYVRFDTAIDSLSSIGSKTWSRVNVSNPPCMSAEVYLVWKIKSKGKEQKICSFGRRVEDAKGLTVGSLLSKALDHVGGVYVHSLAGRSTRYDAIPRDEITVLEKECGNDARLDLKRSMITLPGMMVPLEGEWESVK